MCIKIGYLRSRAVRRAWLSTFAGPGYLAKVQSNTTGNEKLNMARFPCFATPGSHGPDRRPEKKKKEKKKEKRKVFHDHGLPPPAGHTLWSVPDICDDSKFPVDESGLQLMGLKKFAR